MGQATSSFPSSLPDLALHCLRVADMSPADGLVEPYFDYLIGVQTPSIKNRLALLVHLKEGEGIVVRV